MTTPTDTVRPQLPFDRPSVLELSPLYALLRQNAPVTEVLTPAGDLAWLVTRYTEVRALLSDPRLGRSHPDAQRAARISDAAIQNGPTGDYDTEKAAHTRMRKLLRPSFSVRRMRSLNDHVQELVDGYVDELIAARDNAPDHVADLHEHLSFPLPVAVICELLGVPYGDRAYFSDLSQRMSSMVSGTDAQAARDEFGVYMGGLAETKRTEPGEDVISDLVAAQADDPTFTEDELVDLCVGLLFAGHETTVNRIDLGVLLLDTHEKLRADLRADPTGRIEPTVEEILRYSAPGGLGLLRYAHTDVTVGDTTIPTGDAVLLSVAAANRDDTAFDAPDIFDTTRAPNTHVAFGHGNHFCVGAALARTELRSVFTTLARRLPDLRLAGEIGDLAVRDGHVTGGISGLPVTW
ncbi:cytochrome P450 [Nocardia callitridis]|uniref:Cytochrome P450 n=1 Tax=Nocardia callitridis TaxID=648753 RepID=A0ABP9L4F7_9NOCA